MRSVIVLDIGTQFAKALLFETDENKQQENIKYFIKESCSENIFLTCEKIIKKILKKSKTKSPEILLGLNNEILKGKTVNLCFRRDYPETKIDLAELKYLIQKIEWKALDNIRKEFLKETEFKDTEIKLIDAFITNIQIDNQEILDPIGAQGQNICLSVYNIYTLSKWFDDFKKLFFDLKLKLIKLVPISYLLFRYLNLEKSQKGSALIVDIGSKATEITFIKNSGEVIETKNFHLGGQAFSRVLADFLKLDENIVEDVKIKYSKGEISSWAKKELEKLFASNMSSWLSGVKIVFDDFLKDYKFLPNKIFIAGGGAKLPLIESGLKKEKKFKVLNVSNLTELENVSRLALKSFYLNLKEEHDIFSPIFKRVIKLIQNQ